MPACYFKVVSILQRTIDMVVEQNFYVWYYFSVQYITTVVEVDTEVHILRLAPM